MRLLVINAVNDPTTERLRQRNPGKIFRTPTIGGIPLSAPRGMRTLPTDMLSAAVIDEIEALYSRGNILIRELGGNGGAIDFAEIRRRLRLPEKEIQNALLKEKEAATVVATVVPTTAQVVVQEDVIVADIVEELPAVVVDDVIAELLPEAPTPLEAVRETETVMTSIDELIGAEAEEIPPAAEMFTPPSDMAELIEEAKNKKLMAVLALFDVPSTGKAKAALRLEVSKLLVAGADAVTASKAVELLREE